jgi:hypothetical protein
MKEGLTGYRQSSGGGSRPSSTDSSKSLSQVREVFKNKVHQSERSGAVSRTAVLSANGAEEELSSV